MLVAHLVRGAVLSPFKRPGTGREPSREPVVAERVRVADGPLAAYRELCGFPAGGPGLPVTYPHVLGFPLGMRLMSARQFPLPLLGLVHTSIGIRQVRDLDAGEEFTLSVRTAELTPHRRGTEAHLVTEVRAAGELVWESRSTYLARHGGGAGHGGGVESREGIDGAERARGEEAPGRDGRADEAARGLAARAEWRLGGDLGRRYGAVSGDRNPIHLHPLSARLFGFPRAIAHGMWTVGRCLAEHGARGPVRVSARFRAPALLPSTVVYAAGGTAFALRGTTGEHAPRVHLTGEVLPLEA